MNRAGKLNQRNSAADHAGETRLVLVSQQFDRLSSRALAAAARVVMCSALSIGVIAIAGTGRAEGQTAGAIAIKAISTAKDGSSVIVTIEGTGTLPLPTSGAADGPPRIFFDFPGVALRAPAVTASTDPRIRRIRAAVNSVRPLVTRVVLDLVALEPYRLEGGPGRVRVIVGEAGNVFARGIGPVPSLPEPAKPVAVPREPVRSLPPSKVTETLPAIPSVPREPALPPVVPPPADTVARTALPPPERPPAKAPDPAPAPARPRIAIALATPARHRVRCRPVEMWNAIGGRSRPRSIAFGCRSRC